MRKRSSGPTIGTTCPGLTNEDYEYHLSGDAAKYCQCKLTNTLCKGIIIDDPDDQSSEFFSRGKCCVDMDRIKKCPLYGCSKEVFVMVIKEKMAKELDEKLAGM